MPIGIDRREYKRFPCKTPIMHNTIPPDFLYRGTMFNFSKGGLYFESNENLWQGHEISISIKKPPHQFVKKGEEYLIVKILWCQELQGSPYQVGYGEKLI